MALGLIACAIAASAAVGTLAGASFTVGTADALHAAPLFFSDVPNRKADDQCNDRNYDNAIHKTLHKSVRPSWNFPCPTNPNTIFVLTNLF